MKSFWSPSADRCAMETQLWMDRSKKKWWKLPPENIDDKTYQYRWLFKHRSIESRCVLSIDQGGCRYVIFCICDGRIFDVRSFPFEDQRKARGPMRRRSILFLWIQIYKKKKEINGKHPFKVGSTYSTLRQSLNWPKIEEIRRPPKYFLFWAIASFREAISDSTFRNWKRFEESTSTWNDELVMINWIFCRGSINTPFICSIHDWKDRIFDEMFAADDQLINWCDGNQRSWRRCD